MVTDTIYLCLGLLMISIGIYPDKSILVDITW